jgi:hypothetical protein
MATLSNGVMTGNRTDFNTYLLNNAHKNRSNNMKNPAKWGHFTLGTKATRKEHVYVSTVVTQPMYEVISSYVDPIFAKYCPQGQYDLYKLPVDEALSVLQTLENLNADPKSPLSVYLGKVSGDKRSGDHNNKQTAWRYFGDYLNFISSYLHPRE